jgi:microcystin-dependent protein
MAEPFLAEIRIIGFGFAPQGWARCDGQILPINQNQSLFSLLGTTYGGDGRTTFALPDLRGRTPMHKGGGLALGQMGGQEGVALTQAEIPSHDHPMRASSQAANTAEATGAALAQSAENAYVGSSASASLSADSVGNTGGGQPHNNMQPFLTLYFIIALTGTYPPRN